MEDNNKVTMPQLRSSRLVPPILEAGRLKRKLSVASSGDEEYEPTQDDSLVDSVDDESSIQCEEDEKDDDEIEDLKKEGEIPIEELMVMYGLNNSEDYMKVKEESQDSGSDADSAELERRMSMYDKDDWKKEISVGPEYQAEIPALLEKKDVTEEETEEEKDTLLWRPDKLNSDDLNRYLSKVYSLDELPIADAHRDDEEALYILHSHGYKVDNALERAEKQVNSRSRCCVGQIMKPWTEDECQSFENGLKLYGKQFHLIQKNLVPSRTISEVVQFYYLWKKTERSKFFCYYVKLLPKKR
ncbi:hypothetical protein ACHWQZ_G003316 [Mnemiopsis leidyi]